MTLKLVVATNVDGDVFELVLNQARHGVGRRHDNDLRIKETYVSGYHAELVRAEGGEYFLSDLGSSNGTFLNGRRISGKEIVNAGDFIKFGILKVAVRECTDEMPKIVPLKDRPGFVRKDGSPTAAISMEKKTGTVATAGPGTSSGETPATPREAGDTGALTSRDAKQAKQGEELSVREASLCSELAAIAAECDELRRLNTRQTGDLQASKAEANQLRIELRKTGESSQSSLHELETSLRSRIAELETAFSGEKVRADDAATEKSELEETLAALRFDLESARAEGSQLKLRQEEASRNHGRLQAELNRESTERLQTFEALEASRNRADGLVADLEGLKLVLVGKEREIAERESYHSRTESETVRKLKSELSESLAVRDAAEERAAKASKEKQTLAGAFERLKEQFDQTEAALRHAKGTEEELSHGKGLLSRRLEKAEASNSELAARIKEDAADAQTNRLLIEKLELQIRENEARAVEREREQVCALQADLTRASRRTAEDERRRRELEAELSRVVVARKMAEERILSLEARLVEKVAETESTCGLLGETERTRLDLATQLASASSLVSTHLATIGGLRRELAETISRSSEAETSLIARHGAEIDTLRGEWRVERSRREGLELELKNTREGFSEALRHAREESVKAQARLLAEGNAKLSRVEEELSAAIRSREAVDASRNSLEDELNRREEEIERLSERIEDLEIRLRDEFEARHIVLRRLETTKAGFSESLRSGWGRLAEVSSTLIDESASRQESEAKLSHARKEIERLSADLANEEQRRKVEIREGEDRYEALRSEKFTLASEDADLRKIRAEIVAANATKRTVEDELEELGVAIKNSEIRQAELRTQREHLNAEREELKASLNAARLELSSLQKRCSDSREEVTKQTETIAAAERRIQSLRKLESEMEIAVERHRQKHLLNRGEVFSEIREATPQQEFSQEDFYRKLIAKLDLIDDLAKRYDNKWLYPKVSEQLGILKRGFIDFLRDHSVKQFDLEPGTVLSLAERKRIKLVPLQEGAAGKKSGNGSGSHSSRVVETIRPGYVYQNGSQDVIIRKAEVLVS